MTIDEVCEAQPLFAMVRDRGDDQPRFIDWVASRDEATRRRASMSRPTEIMIVEYKIGGGL